MCHANAAELFHHPLPDHRCRLPAGVTVRIDVDRDRCIGSGNCSFYAASTFDLDDDLKVIVLAGSEHGEADAEGDVRAAAEGCPVKAITIHDDPEGDVAGQADESIKGDEPDQKAD